MNTLTIALEWTGALLGLFGAALLASNRARVAPYGWFAFLVANVAMIAFALRADANGLLVQQAGFLATSLVGLLRSRLKSPQAYTAGTIDRGRPSGATSR